MSIRTIKSAQKRAQQRIIRNKSMTAMRVKSQPEDRSEVLSTIKRVNVVRG
ncbi:hypothetical protein NVP1187O_244 [Vibrio phage 1.187.O._10N.286.49.F1]|nr:hypothetical protein NVP1187O_244 [Vibrio phage 1.187.O._10N.286.49.F1]